MMSATMNNINWLAEIKKAKKSAIAQGNLKKIHYTFENGREMVEEYNTDTTVLTRRAWKIKTELGRDGEWEIEIGDPEPSLSKVDVLIREHINQPIISRRVNKSDLEWRIRNLPYPKDTFSVTADPEENCLVVRTSNKKYFKKIAIPELQRVGILPEQKNISFMHKFNSLVITYKKPEKYLELERAIWYEVSQVAAKPQACPPDNCRQS